MIVGAKMKRGMVKTGLLTALLWSTVAQAEPYKGKVVSEVDTDFVYGKDIHVGNTIIPLTISYEKGASAEERPGYPKDFLLKNVAISHKILFEYLEEIGRSAKPCHDNYSLHIFILSNRTWDSSAELRKWRIENGVSNVYAMYNTTPEIAKNNNIYLTNYTAYLNYECIQHELAHYWWEAYCLSDVEGDTERFARLIEGRARSKYFEYFSN